MPRSDYEDDGYDSVDEDAELELSCALHDLAERVKTFEENMKGRLRISGFECEDEDEEIGEDIPEVDDDRGGWAQQSYGYASPKKTSRGRQRQRRRDTKQSKQQEDEDEDEGDDAFSSDDDADGEESKPTKREMKGSLNNTRIDWNEQDQREELSEIKYNISKLLQGFKEQAKALEAAVGDENQ